MIDLKQIRSYPVDIFFCRKCFGIVKTSDVELYNNSLCRHCYDSKIDADGKKVLSWGHGSMFHKGNRRLICAICNKEYHLFEVGEKIVSIEDQEKSYKERMEQRQRFRGIEGFEFPDDDPPFMPKIYDATKAPSGWTNEILCRECLINLHSNNIEEANSENFNYDINKNNLETEKKKNQRIEEIDAGTFKLSMIVMIAVVILFSLRNCSFDTNSNDPAPSDIYYRR